jgi:dihydrofolate reductase
MLKGIVAIAENRVIGMGNNLPWPKELADLSFFKQKTLGSNLIMGRKTFESLGRIHLPNRNIYVLTRDNPFHWTESQCHFKEGISKTFIVPSIDSLRFDLAQDYWVAGGAEIYEKFMPHIQEFFVTYMRGSYAGDVKLPEFEQTFPYMEVINSTMIHQTIRYWKKY